MQHHANGNIESDHGVGRPLSRNPDSPPTQPSGHRLGPIFSLVRLESPVFGRLYALGIFAASVAVFVVAARLNPNGHTMGAHQQLGLPPCGFVLTTGLPCPTCGMTTAFAYTIRGRFLMATYSQPAGFVLALFTAMVGFFGLAAAIVGRRPALNWYRIDPVKLVYLGGLLFVAAWATKLLLGLMDGSLPANR
jgi:hypothetical protein